MDARQTADRHGGYVVAGNMAGVGADFKPEALQEFMKLGVKMPRPVTAYEVVNEQQVGDNHIYEITYSNADESKTIRSTWAQVGDEWKIVSAEPA